MYTLIKTIEKTFQYINNKFHIIFWKIKYGKRIKIGKNLRFRKKLTINIQKDGYLEIGNNNFFNNYCSINCHKKIIIGDNNLFGEDIKMYDHTHIFNNNNKDIRKDFKDGEIIIGDSNWICSNTILLQRSKIGNKNVIGAGTILNDIVESNTIIKAKTEYTIKKITYKG